MTHSICGRGGCYCLLADALLNADGLHLTSVALDSKTGYRLGIETDPGPRGCASCGVIAAAHGRRLVTVNDAPILGLPVVLEWRKRIFRCFEPACPVTTWTERHPLVPPRCKLTTRAAAWAVSLLRDDDTTVAAIARRLGVHWDTVWAAVEPIAAAETGAASRLLGVTSLGVDEHVWKPSARSADRMVTSMVDLTRDEQGQMRARLLDVVPGRSGPAYAGWLQKTPPGFRDKIKHAALDPFRGYANAIRDELPDSIAVLDAFHVVKLGTQVVDEVRRRVQHATLDRRGHKDDPLYRIRGLLRRGVEHLTEKQHARLAAGLAAGDPNGEVELAWQTYQRLRSIYGSRRSDGRAVAIGLLEALHTCPIPEVARLGRTLRQWKSHLLAYFDTNGLSNGGTEAINLLIEKTRRLAHGFRNFDNYRLRILLNASGTRRAHHASTG